jgi:acyl CoA:acetate/3-ketoacid CoA transferase beta subunit
VPGRGPEKVVSNLAVPGFEEDTGLMRLEMLHSGVSVEDVIANTSFDLVIPKSVPQTEFPNIEQVELMRNKIDPLGIRKMRF